MPPRILHLIPYMHPSAGGPPMVVERWCHGTLERGWSVRVVTTDAYSENDPDWPHACAGRLPIDIVRHLGPRGFGYGTALKSVFQRRLSDCDLVHVHNCWGYTNQLALRECVRRGIPYVVSPHGMLDPHSMARKSWKKRLYGGLFEWRSLRQAAAMVFTHSEEERLARETFSALPPGQVVPLAADDPPASRADLAPEFLAAHSSLAGQPIVLFLGRLHPKKGLDLLLPAFASVAVESPASLVLVGPGEPAYVTGLRQRISELDLQDRVVLTGPLEGRSKWSALAAADVFVLPSYQENFAIALVEALRIGTPVICSNRINIFPDLEQAVAVVRCDLEPAGIARELLTTLGNSGRRQELGRRGQSFADQHYTWERSTNRMLEAYETVLASRS